MQQCLEALEGRCLGVCQHRLQESKQGLTVLVFTVWLHLKQGLAMPDKAP